MLITKSDIGICNVVMELSSTLSPNLDSLKP
jgi:hypothetical protein